MASLRLQLLVAALLALNGVVLGHNITDMLSGFPEYSSFNAFLSKTRLADDVNSRNTLTVLVLDNAAMDALAAKHPLSVVKKILSLHIILDYFDPQKLHKLPDGSTLSTTLYQTTGHAPGDQGSVNITDLGGGKVGFGSAAAGSKLDSTYTKSVKQIPYNISVLEISQPIIAPAILAAPGPAPSDVNITASLVKAGCKTFAALISSSGVLKTYETAVEKGLTVFAPNDEAFKAAGTPDLTKLTSAEVVSLLLYHSIAGYTPKGTLENSDAPLSTLATNGAGKYDITVSHAGDDVTLHTGRVNSRLAGTVLDVTPLVIFTVDSVLLPVELFPLSPSPAPAPEPAASLSPTPALAPSPAFEPSASPPAPPMDTPEGAPSEGPSADSESSKSPNSARAVASSKLSFFAAAVVVSWVLMS